MKRLRLILTVLMLTGIAAGCSTDEISPEVQKPPVEIPEPEPEPEPEPGPEPEPEPEIQWESAVEAVAAMGTGWNLGNTLDPYASDAPDGADWRFWETYWGQQVTRPELMVMMKEAGFDAMRVPVSWGIHMDPDGNVYASWMSRVREVVDYVLDAGMYCIVNVHHDTGADQSAWLVADSQVYAARKERYRNLWRQIAEEFKEYDHRLLFESYNEMLDIRRSWCYASFNGGYDAAIAEDAYACINSYAQDFVDVVRSTGGNNSVRNLIVNTYGACSGSGNWNQHLKDPLKEMKLPEDTTEGHLIFEVHAYPSVADLQSMKYEVDDMFQALHTHLASKGAPVIIGEWGSSNSDGVSDYLARRENLIFFAYYFVKKAKEYGMGTFFWMGLSDGVHRTFPAFTQPDLAETIVTAYHGDGYGGKYPLPEDFIYEVEVTYSNQWSELHLCGDAFYLDDFEAVRFRLDRVPEKGVLSVKTYGEEGKEQYDGVTSSDCTVRFRESALGCSASRVTLQYCLTGNYTIKVTDAALIRKDGTEMPLYPYPFWGCSVETSSKRK